MLGGVDIAGQFHAHLTKSHSNLCYLWNGKTYLLKTLAVRENFRGSSAHINIAVVENEQAINESRIAELEQQLKNARVLDESQLSGNLVHVGLEVVIENVATKEIRTYRIVGVTEADPMAGKISDESPIGRALLGHAVEDVVEVLLPTGKIVNYRLVSIAK